MVDFHKPRTLHDALALLDAIGDALPLSGGQTLVPMLNLDVVQPSAIVSLNAIDELRGIARGDDGTLRIGALATHAEIAACDRLDGGQRLLAYTARQIAHPAIRAAGTIGGSCAHGDPTADWPCALVAAGATIELASLAGRRRVAAGDFFVNFMTTALGAGELVVAVHVPPLPGDGVYRKFARVDGDNATVAVAAVVEVAGGVCRFARLAVGAVGPRPLRLPQAEAALLGRPLDAAAARAAGETLALRAEPTDDLRGSAAYKRRILPRLVCETLLEGARR